MKSPNLSEGRVGAGAGQVRADHELRPPAIILEPIFIDCDDLQYRDPARAQVHSQFFEVGRPISLAYSFQHFDRDDAIVRSAHITIVLQSKVAVSQQIKIAKSLARELQLLWPKW
jgi:hypothetical protein